MFLNVCKCKLFDGWINVSGPAKIKPHSAHPGDIYSILLPGCFPQVSKAKWLDCNYYESNQRRFKVILNVCFKGCRTFCIVQGGVLVMCS